MYWVILIVLFNVAFGLGMWFHRFLSKYSYGGTIVVQKRSDGSLLYTLVIGGDLELLQYKKDILLRIRPIEIDEDLDEDSLNRE